MTRNELKDIIKECILETGYDIVNEDVKLVKTISDRISKVIKDIIGQPVSYYDKKSYFRMYYFKIKNEINKEDLSKFIPQIKKAIQDEFRSDNIFVIENVSFCTIKNEYFFKIKESASVKGELKLTFNGKSYIIYIDDFNSNSELMGIISEAERKMKTALKNEEKILKQLHTYITDLSEENKKKSHIDSFELIGKDNGNYEIGIFESPNQIYGILENGSIKKGSMYIY